MRAANAKSSTHRSLHKVSQSIIEHRSRGKRRLADTTEAAQFLFSILKSNRLSHWQWQCHTARHYWQVSCRHSSLSHTHQSSQTDIFTNCWQWDVHSNAQNILGEFILFYFNNVKGIRCHDAKDFLLWIFLWKGRARLGVLNLKYTNHVKLFNKMTNSDTTMNFLYKLLSYL